MKEKRKKKNQEDHFNATIDRFCIDVTFCKFFQIHPKRRNDQSPSLSTSEPWALSPPSPRGILFYWEREGREESQEESDGRKRLRNQPRSRYCYERRSRVKGSTPLVIPNQRSVHRNHDDEGEEEEEEEEEGSARRRPSSLPKKFLRRLWQRRLARERQSGDNAGRKTAGRERGPGPPPWHGTKRRATCARCTGAFVQM